MRACPNRNAASLTMEHCLHDLVLLVQRGEFSGPLDGTKDSIIASITSFGTAQAAGLVLADVSEPRLHE